MAKSVISIIHCRLYCVVLAPAVNRRERSTECVASLNIFGPQFYMQSSYLFHIKWKTQANLCDKSQPTRWITEPNAKQQNFPLSEYVWRWWEQQKIISSARNRADVFENHGVFKCEFGQFWQRDFIGTFDSELSS